MLRLSINDAIADYNAGKIMIFGEKITILWELYFANNQASHTDEDILTLLAPLLKNINIDIWKDVEKELFRIQYQDIRMPAEFSDEELNLLSDIGDLTQVGVRGLIATMMACRHVIKRKLEGDFVECGVWRGGCSILAANMFKLHGVSKKIYLFDTFEGMTPPTEYDFKEISGLSALGKFTDNQRDGFNQWNYSAIDEVKENFRKADLLSDNIIFIKGDVSETLGNKENLPEKISLLRLDTDFYESTKSELEVLYPLLTIGGNLIIDDYGVWAGPRKATDEYFALHNNSPSFHFIDFGGRIGTKFD